MEHKTEQQNLLTPDDIAVQLQVTAEHVRCLIRKKLLSAIDVSTGKKRASYRITKQALDDFLNLNQKIKPAMSLKRFKQLDQVPDLFPDLN